ncbi:TonB-dependent receptor plug domain-containing protein [Sphingomonas sp. CFBP 8760]|uniref:TonB-dependent receptor plug domain-containing protein n=1 Tax=Sphingomonas sp. CFBP 8760 TaxID=2775282 RepID=UPI001783F94B|nr:TonB-dependent receptor [Sphingomonas sp. CFBP 8760]MBD8548855.1 TonB-dependent receptor [Sphingomonas sp. CFBP 8760]
MKSLAILLSAACTLPPPALAQDTEQDIAAAEAAVEPSGDNDIVITGSRFGGRTRIGSATPVDAISQEELQQSGRVDLIQMLKVQVPSFSSPRPLASGVGDFLQPPSLRGLGPGELLVLVNGKRRHTASDLNSSNGIGRGDVSIDFNAIPTLALSRIEVLRDGAAAQYGSDAISGVISLFLDRSVGARAQTTYLTTTEGDGDTYEASASVGVPVGANGVFRLTAAYQDRGGTNRARPDTRQQYFGTNAAGRPVLPSGNFGSGTGLTAPAGTLDPREAGFDRNVFQQGDQPNTNKQIFYNLVAAAPGDVEIYSFGGYNRVDGDIRYLFRRAGQDETVRAIYPDGYSPGLDTRIENFSTAVGLRGSDLLGFGWDLSSVYGVSTQDLTYVNSVNVSLGAASPSRFYRNGSDFYQWTSNLDLTREIPVGDSSPLKLALGLEYREETYRLFSGSPDGYRNGGVPILDGPNAGKPAIIGSQPGPSNGPDDRASLNRHSYALYGEVEKDLFDRLLVSGAVRHERYSDFGDTTNFKVASRLGLIGSWALRGSYNTGFRAPALAQSGYNASNTLILNGTQAIVRVAAVDTPAARLAGANDLKPERSNNISAGTVFDVAGLTVTLDAYQIKVRDRIAISSTFQDARLANFLAANGQSGFAALSFLTNAVDTRTRGVDLVMNYRRTFSDGSRFTGTLAGNYNRTEFDRIAPTPAPIAALGITTPLFDVTQQLRFSDSQPRDKVTLDLNYTRGPVTLSVTNTRYGEVSTIAIQNRTPAQVAALVTGYETRTVTPPGTANSDIIQTFGAKMLTDVELSWQATSAVRLSAGAQNLFDVYPDENLASTVASVAAGTNGSDNAGTQPYNAISPFGFNGRSVFVRASLTL